MLTEIGEVLEQVMTMIRAYDEDGKLLESTQNSMQSIEEENGRRHLMINFYGLQKH